MRARVSCVRKIIIVKGVISMLCRFDYDELFAISNCLKLVSAVYGVDNLDGLKKRVDDILEYMDNTPITEIYDIK